MYLFLWLGNSMPRTAASNSATCKLQTQRLCDTSILQLHNGSQFILMCVSCTRG